MASLNNVSALLDMFYKYSYEIVSTFLNMTWSVTILRNDTTTHALCMFLQNCINGCTHASNVSMKRLFIFFFAKETSIHLIYTLMKIVSMDPDTVHTKMLLTCFRKACLHHYRDVLKRVYYLKKAQLQGVF